MEAVTKRLPPGCATRSVYAGYPGTDDLWAAVQERDGLGDDLVPDYVAKIREGGFYGWPIAYTGPHQEPRHKNVDMAKVKSTLYPDVLLGAHVAVLDILFYTGEQFPQKYRGGMFAAFHGSWNRSQRLGYKIAFIPFSDRKATSGPEDFLTGWMLDPAKTEVWGRPVGLAQMPDGSMLVTDDGAGKIWRVSYSNTGLLARPVRFQLLFAPCFVTQPSLSSLFSCMRRPHRPARRRTRPLRRRALRLSSAPQPPGSTSRGRRPRSLQRSSPAARTAGPLSALFASRSHFASTARSTSRSTATVPSMSGFIQIEPREGEPATEQTEVWLAFDDDNVYVSFRVLGQPAWIDSSPTRCAATAATCWQGNDLVAFMFDTFYDRRNSLHLRRSMPLGGAAGRTGDQRAAVQRATGTRSGI